MSRLNQPPPRPQASRPPAPPRTAPVPSSPAATFLPFLGLAVAGGLCAVVILAFAGVQIRQQFTTSGPPVRTQPGPEQVVKNTAPPQTTPDPPAKPKNLQKSPPAPSPPVADKKPPSLPKPENDPPPPDAESPPVAPPLPVAKPAAPAGPVAPKPVGVPVKPSASNPFQNILSGNSVLALSPWTSGNNTAFNVGRIEAADPTTVTLSLHGTERVFGPGRQITIQSEETASEGDGHRVWKVVENESGVGGLVSETELCRFSLKNGKLQFQWANDPDAELLRYCILEMECDGARLACDLSTPQKTEQVVIRAAVGKEKTDLPDLPDIHAVQSQIAMDLEIESAPEGCKVLQDTNIRPNQPVKIQIKDSCLEIELKLHVEEKRCWIESTLLSSLPVGKDWSGRNGNTLSRVTREKVERLRSRLLVGCSDNKLDKLARDMRRSRRSCDEYRNKIKTLEAEMKRPETRVSDKKRNRNIRKSLERKMEAKQKQIQRLEREIMLCEEGEEMCNKLIKMMERIESQMKIDYRIFISSDRGEVVLFDSLDNTVKTQ